ncbi:MAG: PD-(D/E)XK nuclease family protein [Defluviitaleaceae bacterium]|nr:PD-(D/E)XK nuclease family protein [Defluviitaleaceae bacterium]
MQSIKISVTKIIDLIFRCGDIDGRFNDSSAMHKGRVAHRQIQKNQIDSGENYKHEVSLKHEIEVDGVPVLLQGRSDGIITKANGSFIIDEIKTTTLPLDRIYTQHPQHLAQGKCYAYMYLKDLENPPETISVQLTYFQLESGETRKYEWDFTADELTSFFDDLINKYSMWLRFEREWKILRDESISKTVFPFETYRKGQRELAIATYRTISAQKKLYVSAPTGIGKTLSTIFPAIKAMMEGKAEKLFYLTAKTITRTVAEDTINLMTKQGLRFKSITLRAKDKICPNEVFICNPEYCLYAKGHYDRVNDALMDMLEQDTITPYITLKYAKKHDVCPHELALDATIWCDLVIGDYNHVFDPVASLYRFFGDDKKTDEKNYVFLIDEAHNLVERVRDMYSSTLRKGAFSYILNRLRDKDPLAKEMRQTLRKINEYMKDVSKKYKQVQSYVQKSQDTDFKDLLTQFITIAEQWLASKKNVTHDIQDEILNLYFDTTKFLMISEMYDEHYTSISEISGSDIAITLFCLNPSNIIANKLEMGKSSIIFSATLTPLQYYKEILGGHIEDAILSLPSPFDPSRLLPIIHSGISTKYADRESSYTPISKAINTVVCNKKGNYMCFFPSYEYMHKVHGLFCEKYPNIKTILQKSSMTEDERIAFLTKFDSDNSETLVGFVVLGGIFSEGIDLKGERLIGSIIVSVGIPKITLRQNLIKEYFDQKYNQGYDYAYTFPGMNKVLQAAGRVIRTEEDSGVILLMDSRYSTSKYRNMMPKHWANIHIVRNLEKLEVLLKNK